ncbi:GPW/gp25 [gamma proteobacterium HTCC5015]|nr:GPW/gp25 [gamma proteobacterium HTCC5015]
MSGMNAQTGQQLDGLAHIQQSVQDILTTPVGSRVMRREYGSFLPDLIDAPTNEAALLQAYAASAMALAQWEPRIELNSIKAVTDESKQGGVTLELDVIRYDTGTPERAKLEVRT